MSTAMSISELEWIEPGRLAYFAADQTQRPAPNAAARDDLGMRQSRRNEKTDFLAPRVTDASFRLGWDHPR